jgi:hypothetical protein
MRTLQVEVIAIFLIIFWRSDKHLVLYRSEEYICRECPHSIWKSMDSIMERSYRSPWLCWLLNLEWVLYGWNWTHKLFSSKRMISMWYISILGLEYRCMIEMKYRIMRVFNYNDNVKGKQINSDGFKITVFWGCAFGNDASGQHLMLNHSCYSSPVSKGWYIMLWTYYKCT